MKTYIITVTWVALVLSACGTVPQNTGSPAAPSAATGAPSTIAKPESTRAEADARGEVPDSASTEKATSGPKSKSALVPSPKHGPAVVESENLTSFPLPAGTKVLHVGDSFAGALGKPLGKMFEERDVKSVLKHTDSSYLTDWAWDKKLQKYLWKYNPDFVIVTLGANELGIADPQRREKTIKKIVATIGDKPCLWVAIPLWNGPQNGLLEVIRKSSSPCTYMDTNEIFDVEAMSRIKDGIHPTTKARAEWAEFVLAWLEKHRKTDGEKPWSLRP